MEDGGDLSSTLSGTESRIASDPELSRVTWPLEPSSWLWGQRHGRQFCFSAFQGRCGKLGQASPGAARRPG